LGTQVVPDGVNAMSRQAAGKPLVIDKEAVAGGPAVKRPFPTILWGEPYFITTTRNTNPASARAPKEGIETASSRPILNFSGVTSIRFSGGSAPSPTLEVKPDAPAVYILASKDSVSWTRLNRR